jgi:DNA replication initiation complex subunit (GINS family)
MLCLDEVTSRKLEALTQTFYRSAAEVIRQLIARASPEGFPESRHLAVKERQELAHRPSPARHHHRQRP